MVNIFFSPIATSQDLKVARNVPINVKYPIKRAVTARHIGKNRVEFIHIFLDATKLGEQLKNTSNGSLFQNGFDGDVFVKDRLGIIRESWNVHVQENRGTIHQVHMGFHGTKIVGRDMFKAQMLLDVCMKDFNLPPQPIAHEDVFRGDSKIGAGHILAATIPSRLEC